MPFVAIPDVTALTVDWLHDNQPCVNTFHYDTGTLTATQLEDLCTTVMNYIEAHWMGGLPTNVQLVKVRAVGMWTAGAPENQVSPATAIHGTDSGEALPNNVSFAIKRKTGLSGRHNRGRIYWVGLTDGQLADANSLHASLADGLVSFCNGLLVAVNAATPGGPEVIVDKVHGTKVNVSGYAYTDLFIDSSRRRLPAHNIHR